MFWELFDPWHAVGVNTALSHSPVHIWIAGLSHLPWKGVKVGVKIGMTNDHIVRQCVSVSIFIKSLLNLLSEAPFIQRMAAF